MKRDEYLKDQDVSAFIEWAAKLVSGEWGLEHSWSSNDPQGRNPRQFDCQSLYEACESYYWNGGSFEGMAARFDEFRLGLQVPEHPTAEDMRKFLDTANEVIEWGGTQKPKDIRELEIMLLIILHPDKLHETQPETSINKDELLSLHRAIIVQLNRLMIDHPSRLSPEQGDTDGLTGFKYMGAGYSKIYSAMIDDFPIYDSRVGCGLAWLIWLFFEDEQPDGSRELLMLRVPKDQGRNLRIPPGFKPVNTPKQHAESNLKAAWILGELVKRPGPFRDLPKKRRVMALQAALFMIGYQPLGKKAVRKS